MFGARQVSASTRLTQGMVIHVPAHRELNRERRPPARPGSTLHETDPDSTTPKCRSLSPPHPSSPFNTASTSPRGIFRLFATARGVMPDENAA